MSHRLEHLGGDDDGAGKPDALLDDALLEVRHVFNRHADTEVTAGHHDGVRFFNDFNQGVDGFGRFDLRHNHHVVAGQRTTDRGHVGSGPNEGNGENFELLGTEGFNAFTVVGRREAIVDERTRQRKTGFAHH